MSKPLLSLLLCGLSLAQAAKNPEYSAVGSKVSVLAEQYDDLVNLTNTYGASILGSHADTTTYVIMPTILNTDGRLFNAEYTNIVTLGPTTKIMSDTQTRDWTDLLYTYSEFCSIGGTTTAECHITMSGMPEPGFPGGTWILSSTTTAKAMSFIGYQIVVRTTTLTGLAETATTSSSLVGGTVATVTPSASITTQTPINLSGTTGSSQAVKNSGISVTSGVSSTTSLSAAITSTSTATGGHAQITGRLEWVFGAAALAGAFV